MIKEKIYYYISLETLSPLSIGNGTNDLTDHDLIRDANGDVFIPATTLAGVFVHFLTDQERKIILKEKYNEKIMSPMFVSDATVLKGSNYKTSVRHGIKVDENKISEDGAKYDIEIAERGLKLNFRIELTIRDDDKAEMMAVIDKILSNINNGNIVFGLKSKRGFGKAKITECYYKVFTPKDITALVNFDKYDKSQYEKYEIKDVSNDNFDILEVYLKQIGGISIRSYSAKAFDVDFEHIKSNGKPVIPGMSFNGLIRSQVEYYNKLLKNDKSEIDKWFGYVEGKQAKASKIIIEESTLENAKEITIFRNKIDRFSGSTVDSALFSERVQYNGDTILTIRIPKTDNSYILGLIALTLKDIDNGLIALGGQTSIGRGIFKIKKVLENNNEIDLDDLIAKMEVVNE